jgi:putative FmdB family regulatory protein
LPTYEYACKACGHRLEAVQKFTDESLTVCPECGGALRKVFGAPGIVLKGSGFYKTDTRAQDKRSTSDSSSGSNGSDSAKTDTKSDTGTKSDAGSGSGSGSGSGAKTESSSSSGNGSTPAKESKPAASTTS